jgi:hypothetical protein
MNPRLDRAFRRVRGGLVRRSSEATRRRVRSTRKALGIEALEDRCLLSSFQFLNGVLEINANNGTGSNTITLNQDPNNPAMIDVMIDTLPTSFNPMTVPQVQVSTTVPTGVATNNQLELKLGSNYTSVTYSATGPQAGTIVGLGPLAGPNGVMITYTGIDAVLDATTAATGTFTDNIASDTALKIGDGATNVNGASGYASIQGTKLAPTGGTAVSAGRPVTQAQVEVASKASLTVDAKNDASVVVDGTFAADGQRQQTIMTEASGGVVTVLAAGVNTTVNTNAAVANTVNVGMPGTLPNLQGSVTLTNAAGSATALVADVSAETGANIISLSDTELVIATPGRTLAPSVQIPGVTIADIHYPTAGVKTLTINGGSGATNTTVTNTGSQTSTTLNGGNGNDSYTVKAASGPLLLNTGTGTNVVDVALSQASTYNLTVHGSGPAQNNTLNVHDDTRAPEIENCVAGANSGKIMVSYLVGGHVVGRSFVPIFRTFDIPYTDIGHVATLPDAEHTLVQALYHLILERNGSQAELDAKVALLQKTGKIPSLVTALENSPEGRKLAKQRPKIVLGQLPDFAEVQAELAASKPHRKHR